MPRLLLRRETPPAWAADLANMLRGEVVHEGDRVLVRYRLVRRTGPQVMARAAWLLREGMR